MELIKLFGFILTIIGLIGLLLEEFYLDWGRPATVAFAAVEVAGLIMLAAAHRAIRKE